MALILGAQLRHLIGLLDGAMDAAYADAGLPVRPRYVPVMRALMEGEPLTIGEIAEAARTTQPAATQTVALMLQEKLVSVTPGTKDARQRLIRLTKRAHQLLPQLQLCWEATVVAADKLDAELPYPLRRLVGEALDALAAESFADRIREARAKQNRGARRPTTGAAVKRAGGTRTNTR